MNKQTTPKSTTTHIAALCVILAAFCLPVAQLQAQGRGGPPTPVNFNLTLSGFCSFDILAQGTGKAGVISLPDGGFIFTAPATFVTMTNLSDTTKSVTLSFTSTEEQSPVQNGTITQTFRGRSGLAFGPTAPNPNTFFLLIGTWTIVIDANTGQVLQGPTGNGQMINMCDLLE
jgi:hypothetical protein